MYSSNYILNRDWEVLEYLRGQRNYYSKNKNDDDDWGDDEEQDDLDELKLFTQSKFENEED